MTEQQKTPQKITVLSSPPTRRKPAEATKRVRPRRPVAVSDADAPNSDSAVPEDDENEMGDTPGPFGEPVSADTPTTPKSQGIIAQLDKPESVDKGKPNSGVPSVDEWQDFIGRIVLRTATEGYLTLMLRDCDLTPQEEAYLELSKQDLKEMSAPFAGFANKNKTMRKHGRSIISAADSWEALVTLSIWMRRVHKVAKRHRPEIAQAGAERRMAKQQHAHQSQQQMRQPVMVPVPATEVNGNGTTRPDESDGGPSRRPSAPPAGHTFNPGTG